MLGGELTHARRTRGANFSFERIRAVVDAGVQHAAIAAAGMNADARLFFQDQDARIRIAALEFPSGSKTDDAGADDEVVKSFQGRLLLTACYTLP